MTEESKPKNNVVQGLGIASLVMGILALPLSFVPCCGAMAIFPAILGVLLAGAGVLVARSQKANGGLSTAGLVVSGLAFLLALSPWLFFSTAATKAAVETHNAVQERQRQAPK